MIISISHHCRHGRDFRGMRPKWLISRFDQCCRNFSSSPLGSGFQVPQLGRSPMSPLCKLELGNRRRSMSRMPNLPIMKFPSTFSGSKNIGWSKDFVPTQMHPMERKELSHPSPNDLKGPQIGSGRSAPLSLPGQCGRCPKDPLRIGWILTRVQKAHAQEFPIRLERSNVQGLKSLLHQLWAVEICPSERARKLKLAN